jgi:phosphotriesterase-related protein
MTRPALIASLVLATVPALATRLLAQAIHVPDQSGRAMTVLGPIDPAQLGPTLTHEHLFIRFWVPLEEPDRWTRLGLPRPQTPEELAIWNTPFTARDRMKLLTYFQRNRDGFTLDDLPTAVREVQAYQALGGRTIVDVTSTGLDPVPDKLREVAKRTGINLVAGTGFYRRAWHPADMAQRSLDDLTQFMVREIAVGMGSSGVRAGIIGEIPAEHLVFTPQESDEVRVLRAAARASRATGAAITLHSDFGKMPNLHTSLDILEEEGADLSRVVVGHVASVASADPSFLESLLRRGVYLQFDVLGNPLDLELPNRPMVDAIEALLLKGYSARILVSHDVCTKFQLREYGGYGFTFVQSVLVPHLLARGVSTRAIDDITVNNPRRVLTFVKPGPAR